MANNKFYGYTPKYAKASGKEGTIRSGAEEGNTYEHLGNSLDRVNPYEFKKGMDYELLAIGCARLKESTPEEREKATEKVIKNLSEHGGYYTSLITFETLFRGRKSKPNFKTWLKEQGEEYGMKETNQKFKNDKMTEPKVKVDKDLKVSLKEAIKNEIKHVLKEKKEDKLKKSVKNSMDNSTIPTDDTDPSISEKKGSEKSSKFDKEREVIEKEIERFKGLKSKQLEKYKKSKKDKKAISDYKDNLKISDKDKKRLIKIADKFEVSKTEYGAKDIPNTIKKLEKRLKSIDKEEEAAETELRNEKLEVAATDLTREEQIRLLNIIKEGGISLREGAMGIKPYYEIAKKAYLEGLSKGYGI
jgi:hypothetical protein